MKEIIAKVAAILSALRETNGGPESALYMALGMDINLWNIIRGVMLKAGYITISGHYVTLTAKGLEKAIEVDAAMAKA
jgi:hypothetical protein